LSNVNAGGTVNFESQFEKFLKRKKVIISVLETSDNVNYKNVKK